MNHIRVKLAAIARDEAAYLPEWIFHHLEFGFDEIEIYINNTTDNSLAVLANIKRNHPVVVTDANALFKQSTKNFQGQAYQALTKKAIADGFTHLMFLDIDEFWTPADFNTNIKQALAKFNYPQALCLNWFIHHDESDFSPCYREQFKVRINSHVKTIFQLDSAWDKVNIHNVIGKDVKYTRGNGEAYDFGDSSHCGIADNNCLDHDYYVIHRMYRSQMEYVSLIGRGRPNKAKVKNNRNGFYDPTLSYTTLKFDEHKLIDYYQRFNQFLLVAQLSELAKESREFVEKRYQRVIKWAKNATLEEAGLYCKLFKNLELKEVTALREALQQNHDLSKVALAFSASHSTSYLLLLLWAKIQKRLGFKALALKNFLRASQSTTQMDCAKIVDRVERSLTTSKLPTNKHADVYRDIAKNLHLKGELNLACGFIAKAKKSRPKGPLILKLHDTFMKEQRQSNL